MADENLAFIASALTALFLGLFFVGLYMPFMALRIDERHLYPPEGPVPYSAKPLVEALAIPDLLRSDVSLWSCMVALAGDVGGGEATSVLALLLFSVFVVALTLADMAVLVVAAWLLRSRSRSVAAASLAPREAEERLLHWGLNPSSYLAAARILTKLSMLDVCIMGVFVMTLCMTMYQKVGVAVSASPGILVLGAAELVHFTTYHLISGAVQHANLRLQAAASAAAAAAAASQHTDTSSDKPNVHHRFHTSRFLCCSSIRGSSTS